MTEIVARYTRSLAGHIADRIIDTTDSQVIEGG